jgi:hypothetical protein
VTYNLKVKECDAMLCDAQKMEILKVDQMLQSLHGTDRLSKHIIGTIRIQVGIHSKPENIHHNYSYLGKKTRSDYVY